VLNEAGLSLLLGFGTYRTFILLEAWAIAYLEDFILVLFWFSLIVFRIIWLTFTVYWHYIIRTQMNVSIN